MVGPANGWVSLRVVAVLAAAAADRCVQPRSPLHRCTAAVAEDPVSRTGRPFEISAGRQLKLSM